MTELEQELMREIEMSNEIYKHEMIEITKFYKAELEKTSQQIIQEYQAMLTTQNDMIQKQFQILQNYENMFQELESSLEELKILS